MKVPRVSQLPAYFLVLALAPGVGAAEAPSSPDVQPLPSATNEASLPLGEEWAAWRERLRVQVTVAAITLFFPGDGTTGLGGGGQTNDGDGGKDTTALGGGFSIRQFSLPLGPDDPGLNDAPEPATLTLGLLGSSLAVVLALRRKHKLALAFGHIKR